MITRRGHDHEGDIRMRHRLRDIGGCPNTTPRLFEQIFKPGLGNRGLAFVQQAHEALVQIDPDDAMALGGKTGDHGRAKFSQSNY